jgi:chemotaxis-related protein WspB
MLLLLFHAGETLYAIDARHVAEVVPRVELRAIPHAPGYLLGLLGYRGRAVPAIDFRRLIGQGPAREALSTRVILTRHVGPDGAARLVGVVAENVSQVARADEFQVVTPAMNLDEAPYLGAVLRYDGGLVQLVEADKLLDRRMQEALYGTEGATR